MIESFKLPDLVLGVRIRADTTGARRAAQDLSRSVSREINRPISGTPYSGAGRASGGGLGSAMLGSGLGAMLGIRGLPAMKKVSAFNAMSASAGTRGLDVLATINELFGQKATQGYLKFMGGDKGLLSLVRQFKPAQAQAAVGIMGKIALLFGTVGSSRGILGLVSKLARATGFSKLGTISRLFPLLAKFGPIGLVLAAIAGAFMSFVKSLRAASEYIRKSALPKSSIYRRFTDQSDKVSASLTNIWRQLGLMFINVYPLVQLLESLNVTLRGLGSLTAFLTPIFKLNALINPFVWQIRLLNMALSLLPKFAGGVSLPQASPGRFAPAATEGSVEAYRIVNQSMSDYAARTATATEQSAGWLRRLATAGGLETNEIA
jgi:hypothetical protein